MFQQLADALGLEMNNIEDHILGDEKVRVIKSENTKKADDKIMSAKFKKLYQIEMAHYDLQCLQIQLLLCLALYGLNVCGDVYFT